MNLEEIKDWFLFIIVMGGVGAICCTIVSLCVLGVMYLILWLIGWV